ncbi:MAG: hypothetical protein FWF41_00575 [Betaproteobacteria bacterium]|nr:hypothetical protein [Betaproteobacteria bacterium]
MLKTATKRSKNKIFGGLALFLLIAPLESFAASNPQETGFNALFSNNVRISNKGVPPLIKPDSFGLTNNPSNSSSVCSASDPIAYARQSFNDFHARFSAADLICPSFGNLRLANINPGKELESYYWKDGYTKLVFKFSLQAQYKGRGGVQPVLEFFHRNWNNNDRLAFYIAPVLFDGFDPTPTNPGSTSDADWLNFDSACANGCTGRPIFTGWFGDRNNPYMGFDGQRCPSGNASTVTPCQLTNAQLILTKEHFQKILDKLVELGRLSNAEALAEDWFLGDYAFNVEMPSDFASSAEPGSPITDSFNSFIDFQPTGVALNASK